jgi:hypothetical protein
MFISRRPARHLPFFKETVAAAAAMRQMEKVARTRPQGDGSYRQI